MKVAVGFFGITRSLKYTIQSINQQIFDVLKRNNIEYDIYMHTYYLTDYKNVRTGEYTNNMKIDNEEYKLLNADYLEIDNQSEIKIKLDLLSYRTQPDPWDTNYGSVDNFILGQYSKLRLTKMIEPNQFKYDYILFMRPDCLYINELPIQHLNLINDKSIIIPNFHLFGQYDFNDRFCITNKSTYKIYGEVFNLLLDISKNKCLHSETILGEIINNHKLNIIRIKFNFSRVRLDGRLADNF